MTILLTLQSTLDVILGPELITWLSYKDSHVINKGSNMTSIVENNVSKIVF
jgi:hypothetical protein